MASPAGALRPGGSVLDYIPRAEHLRLLEARLAAKESDAQLELNSRVAQARLWRQCAAEVVHAGANTTCATVRCAGAFTISPFLSRGASNKYSVQWLLYCPQVEREWQWKLESKEQEVSSLTARTRQASRSQTLTSADTLMC